MIGQTIAHYRVSSKLGEGGMGAVYRAHDSKLGRDVAIKVLPAAVAADAEYLARFRREAQVLASLNHPNIAAIYGVEENAIVMELVEGAELRGPLPVAEALPIARQIAEALEAAHERGIVHRDLKPANIKITSKGTVKVLDFGLAKSIEAPAMAASPNSPTLTIRSTHAGMIMGTAGYMSPEQARGKTVDHRADIWAFGVVLFELLSGKEAFAGDTVTDVLAGVVREDPDWSALPADTPPRIRRLLERCLRKDPRARLQAIGEARIVIDEPEASPVALGGARSSRVPWIIASAALLALAACVAWLWPRPVQRPLVRMAVDLGSDSGFEDRYPVVFSPDGRRIAYLIRADRGRLNMVTRLLDQSAVRTLAEVEQASAPFFSPDGQWVAFASDGKLRRTPVEGGPVTAIATGVDSVGFSGRSSGAWGEDDSIVVSTRLGLRRVPASGGTAQVLTDLAASGDADHLGPVVLPGAKAVLFTAVQRHDPGVDGDIKAVEVSTGKQTVIVKGASRVRYAGEGRLLYTQGDSLYAVRFDPKAIRVTGEPVRLSDVVGASTWFQPGSNGLLMYAAARTQEGRFRIVAYERSGGMKEIGKSIGDYRSLQLSPDGTRLAYSAGSDGMRDIWIYDLERDTPLRLTTNGRSNWEPIWAPDNTHVVYCSAEEGGANSFWWIPADGSREPVLLFRSQTPAAPRSFSPDGRYLVIDSIAAETRSDIAIVPLDLTDRAAPKADAPQPFLNSAFNERNSSVSPDGKWIAYSSNESGQQEVYVRGFPKPEGKQQISSEGGDLPMWARHGREIVYRGADDRLMTVPYEVRGGRFVPGRAAARSDAKLPPLPPGPNKNQDLSPDGKTLFVLARSRDGVRPEARVHLIVNFMDEVDRRLASAR